MFRKIKLSISVSLLLFVFVTPYITLIHSQDYTISPTPITISPIPPEMTTIPPKYTIPPDITQGYSAFATRTPRIDGAITSGFNYKGVEVGGEWDDAVKIDFQLNITQSELKSSVEAHNASLYIKNDYINIYLALVVYNEELDEGDMVHFNFDNKYNQMKDAGDDQLLIDGYENEFRDLYIKTDGSSGYDSEQNGVGAAQWYSPFFTVQPIYTFVPITVTATPIAASSKAAQDVLMLTLPGTWIFEVAHPLNSANDKQDLNAQPGEIIGISTTYWDVVRDDKKGGFPAFEDWSNMLKYKIAGPSIPGTNDLKIHSLELSQAVQNDTSGLPLARRKTTVARVFLDIGTATGSIPANVYLYGTDGKTGKALPGPIVASVNAPISSFRTRTVITHSANFLLPTSWTDLDFLKLTAFVTSTTMETNFDNNWLVPTKQFSFHNMRVLNVYEIPINTGTATKPNIVSKTLMTQYEKAMQKVFPVEKINFKRLDWRIMGGNWTGTFPQANNKLNEVMGQIVYAWLLGYALTGEIPFPLPDLIFGYYTQNVGGLGGLSNPTWDGGKGYVAVGYIAVNEELTMAHELTHNLDRDANGAGTWGRHTGPNTAGNCGAQFPDPNWPHFDDDISEVGLDASVWPPVIIPWDYPDYMSYCDSSSSTIADATLQAQYTQWISDYRWEQLFEELEQSPLYPAIATKASAKSARMSDLTNLNNPEEHIPPILQITGWISKDLEGSIDSILQLESPHPSFLIEILAEYPQLESFIGDIVQERSSLPVPFEREATPYELVVIDPAGNEIRSFYFSGKFLNHEDFEEEQTYFSQHIPQVEGLEPGARIELRIGERVLDVQEVTRGVPEVHLLAPRGGENWISGEEAFVEWEARDPDGDELIYTVQYSPDGGNFWIPLTTGRREPFLAVDPSKLPGSGEKGAYIRVLATDGFNTGEGRNTEPFYVRDKSPQVFIDMPVDGQVFGHGDLIPLKGHGFDLEDGELPDSALMWEFAGGILGYGSALEVVRLGPGEHLIHLIGIDSAGNEGVAHVRVVIGLEEVVPPIREEEIIRVGPTTLSFYANVDAPIHSPGDPAVLIVEITNNGIDPALAVEVLMRLPIGLFLLSDSDRVGWEVIEPDQTVVWEFVVVGEEEGTYEIGFELKAVNRSPAVELVKLHIGEEIPQTTPPEVSGLSIRAAVDPPSVPIREPTLLFVRVTNNGEEPVYEVEVLLDLPPGLFLDIEPEPTVREVLEPKQAAEWEFMIVSEKEGVFEIGIEVNSANLSPAYTAVELHIGEEPPETTSPPETSPRFPIPGFEIFPMLLAIPVLLWLRRRRHRR